MRREALLDQYHRLHQQTPPPPPRGAGEGFRLCQGSISSLTLIPMIILH